MRDANSHLCQTQSTVSAAIGRVCAEGAESSDHAVLVGDRAGVVEWANAAWSQITGFPLSETIHKPITHFLDVAGIELELVDFIGQHFLEGRTCIIEFPFETFDEREIPIRLEVQPLRNAAGELDVFVATARIVPEHERHDQAAHRKPETARCEAVENRRSTIDEARLPVSLSDSVGRVCKSVAMRASDRAYFDLALAPHLPEIELHVETLGQLTESLIDAALQGLGSSWGCITVLTGLTMATRGYVSEAHPVVARPAELAAGPHLFMEVHDTGLPLGREALARVRERRASSCLREVALLRAHELVDTLGATLHIDGTPGCGSQSLVLIPLPQAMNIPPLAAKICPVV
jgi:PAS domain S-box-containing protein